MDSDQLAPDILKYADVTLTAAQIKALGATPITLVAAGGANTAIVVERVSMRFTTGGEVLTETDDNPVIEYAGGTDILVIESTGLP